MGIPCLKFINASRTYEHRQTSKPEGKKKPLRVMDSAFIRHLLTCTINSEVQSACGDWEY